MNCIIFHRIFNAIFHFRFSLFFLVPDWTTMKALNRNKHFVIIHLPKLKYWVVPKLNHVAWREKKAHTHTHRSKMVGNCFWTCAYGIWIHQRRKFVCPKVYSLNKWRAIQIKRMWNDGNTHTFYKATKFIAHPYNNDKLSIVCHAMIKTL